MKKTFSLFVMAVLLMVGGRLFAQKHVYVDLGLPSGTLWATCNVGADTPEEYGDFFAWGETKTKSVYNWDTYKYCNGDGMQLTKYNVKSDYGYNGFSDGRTTLRPDDDAATANWGDGWCIPTKEQWEELMQKITNQWTTRNGVNGRLFTASNGNSLFLPAVGIRWDDKFHFAGSDGYYWSSSLYTDDPGSAWEFAFGSDDCDMISYGDRNSGRSVRPVRSAKQN